MHRSIFNIAVNTRPSHGCWMPFLGPAAPWNTSYSRPQTIKHHVPACLAQGLLKQMLRGEIFTLLIHWFHLPFDFLTWNVQVRRGLSPVFCSIFSVLAFISCWCFLFVGVKTRWSVMSRSLCFADGESPWKTHLKVSWGHGTNLLISIFQENYHKLDQSHPINHNNCKSLGERLSQPKKGSLSCP